jgi:hypothetical protein
MPYTANRDAVFKEAERPDVYVAVPYSCIVIRVGNRNKVELGLGVSVEFVGIPPTIKKFTPASFFVVIRG